MKTLITERYCGELLVPTIVLQPENQAEQYQVEYLAQLLKKADVLNYDAVTTPYRNTQICLPLIHN